MAGEPAATAVLEPEQPADHARSSIDPLKNLATEVPGFYLQIPPTGIPWEDVERQIVIRALEMSNWVQKDAAELLSISPRVMNYKIKTLRIAIQRRSHLATT